MTIEIYKNYGCLAAEKRIIYTYGAEHPTAVTSDRIKVEIPEGWETYKNAYDEIMLTAPWGWNYSVNDVLGGNDCPVFTATNKGGRTVCEKLKIVNQKR